MKKLIMLLLVLVLGLTTEVANADFTFGEPTNLGPTVNSASTERYPFITIDRLSLYFGSNRSGGFGGGDIWVTRRATIDDDWGTPVNLGPPVNGSFYDNDPHISPDGLELYFTTHRPGSIGEEDIWISRRQSKDDIWSEPVSLGSPINTSDFDWGVNLSADGLEMYFGSMGHSGFGWMDLYVARRSTTIDDWGPPVNIGPVVNSYANESSPSLSVDGLVLFFCDHPYSSRPGGFGGVDIWMTRRPTKNDPWLPPENLGPIINSTADDRGESISADGSILYFSSKRTGGFGGWDLYEAPIIPIVDLNGDRIVDAADMCIMIDYWGTDEPLCDIGPMPWGDGIVDVQDLIVLAEHLFEDYRLIAHWELDETEGSIASDSIDINDGTCHGEPIWQPAGGKVGGALEFDGTDDYVSTPFVLNPGTGQFSVFAWIKGGAPGQVIISQTGGSIFFGATWLGTDPSYGKFMTKLADPQPLLQSDFVITDGQWHHIGLVWDRLLRHLYVDGAEVVEDVTKIVEVPSDGGLHIGAAKDLDVGSFWSGLIDDVRIYNVALTPEEIEAFVQ